MIHENKQWLQSSKSYLKWTVVVFFNEHILKKWNQYNFCSSRICKETQEVRKRLISWTVDEVGLVSMGAQGGIGRQEHSLSFQVSAKYSPVFLCNVHLLPCNWRWMMRDKLQVFFKPRSDQKDYPVSWVCASWWEKKKRKTSDATLAGFMLIRIESFERSVVTYLLSLRLRLSSFDFTKTAFSPPLTR